MQRVRRDSASSTDSWSIIEQRCSPEISSADSLDTDVSDSESEVEIAEEAYDSRDSDIEVDENDLTEDEEEAEVAEEEAEERDGKSDEEEDSEEEERIPETEENIEWLTQREAMEGEGKRYVAPEKIKCSLDSYIEKKDNSRKIALFMGFSFTFFVIQNIALMYLLSFTHSHARGPPEQNWGIMKTTKAVTPFESLFQNPTLYRASLQCWFTRALKGQNGTNELKSCSKKPILESWQNLTDLYMQRSWYRQEPTVIKSPKPSKYGQTTISRQRSTFDVCKRKDSPPTLAKSLYPCDQISPMPTPPKINEPQSPFSALKSIIGQSVQRIEPVSFEKADLPIKSLFKTSPKPKPRARSFNYKIEMSPVPKMNKNVKKDLVPRLQQSPVQFKKSKSVQSHQRCPVRTRNVSKEVMVVPKEWKMTKIRKERNFKPRKMIFKEKKRFSMKASQLMRNSSYSSDKQQCKRHEFKQFRRQLLEDKSRRRRQRLVDYKIEKPCRAIYETPVPSKKVAKLEAKIQKKIQKIEKRIQKRKASFRV